MTPIKAKPARVRPDFKKIVSWLGSALMIVSLGFIILRLRTYGVDFSLLTSQWVVAGLVLVVIFEGITLNGAALNYRAIIKNVSGVTVPRPFAVLVYNISNMYKYIPGGVMYIVGRNRLAIDIEGLSHKKVAFATVFEGAAAIIGALVVAFVFSFEHALNYTRQFAFSSTFVVIVFVILLLIVSAVFYFRSTMASYLKDFFSTVEILNLSVLVKRLGFALVLMFALGLSFVAVIALLGQPMTISLAMTLLGLYILGWLIGFLTPGAPSGLGIREAVLLMFLSGIVNESILLSAMLIHRVILIAGDCAAYCFALGYEKVARRRVSL